MGAVRDKIDAPSRPSFSRRLMCGLIDLCVCVIIEAIVKLIAFAIWKKWFVRVSVAFPYPDLIMSMLRTLSGAFVVAYFVAFYAKYGKTVGKMIGGCKVIMKNGDSITIKVAFLRMLCLAWEFFINLARTMIAVGVTISGRKIWSPKTDMFVGSMIVWSYILFIFADLIWILVDGKRGRAVHDIAAGTMVVVDGRENRPSGFDFAETLATGGT